MLADGLVFVGVTSTLMTSGVWVDGGALALVDPAAMLAAGASATRTCARVEKEKTQARHLTSPA